MNVQIFSGVKKNGFDIVENPFYNGTIEERSSMEDLIFNNYGVDVINFLKKHTKINDPATFITSTGTRFNIEKQKVGKFKCIINFTEINNARWINKFFETVNQKLPYNGLFIANVETYTHRKKRMLKRFIFPLNWIIYTIDFIITRIFPKIWFTKRIYFHLTRGKGRVLSKAETLGRLYSCGFEVVDEGIINNKLFLAVRKVKEPQYDLHPTYGPLIKLSRSGKGGKLIKVYKLRTMHPYSEYIQKYVYELNGTSTGDKADNDFRINTVGRFFRKFWLDELPMIINLLKGDLKLVGVRPLSFHKLSMYPDELRELRKKHKPGLVPPYYADMPRNQVEMWDSEKRYLLQHEKHPFVTDFKYFWKAFCNIVFKKARSG